MTTMQFYLVLMNVIHFIAIQVNAQCNINCADCGTSAECTASTLVCAFSTLGGCVSPEETPFIYIFEETGGYNWFEAEVRCQTQFNTNLASIRTEQENEWAVSLCQSAERARTGPACWIGGYKYYNDNPTEFSWTDDASFTFGAAPYSPIPFGPWKYSQPDFEGCDAANEVCCLKILVSDGVWTDLPNGQSCRTQTEAALCRTDCICEDDGNECTQSICVEGECVYEPVNTTCSTECIPDGKCVDGVCVGICSAAITTAMPTMSPVPTAAITTAIPTDSSESSESSESEESSDDIAFRAQFIANNINKNEPTNDNKVYNLTIGVSSTWKIVWIVSVLGVFLLCNGTLIFYWFTKK